MQALLLKALLLGVLTRASGMRVQVTTGRACDDSSVYCKCTTGPVSSLTLISGKTIEFGIKTNVSFAVSGPGFTKIREDNANAEMECIEDAIPREKTCNCNGAPGADSVVLNTGQCLYNSEARMCLDDELADLKYLRCYSKNNEKYAYATAPYNVPKKLDSVQLKLVEYCQPWAMNKETRPVMCYYESTTNIYPQQPSTDKLAESCQSAMDNVGFTNVRSYYQVGAFKVVNSFGSKFKGLAYRNSKDMNDKTDISVKSSQKWDTTVEGITTGDGWLGTDCHLSYCKYYLPMWFRVGEEGNVKEVVEPTADTTVACEMQMKLEKCLNRLKPGKISGAPLAYFW